jgi:DNA-directed RNA polymerase subunit H
MEEHPSFLVYKHLREFAAVRGYKCVESDSLIRNDFLTKLGKVGYYIYQLNHIKDKNQVIVMAILPPDSDYAKKGKELGNMIRIMEKSVKGKEFVEEIIVIAPEKVYSKKNIIKKVESFGIASALGETTKDNYIPSAKYYNIYPYKNFYLNILKHHSIGEYTIVSHEETSAILEYQRRDLNDFAVIFSNSAPISWIGARPGDFLKLVRKSPTAGKEVKYMHVVKRS